jgi:hypothetical protein
MWGFSDFRDHVNFKDEPQAGIAFANQGGTEITSQILDPSEFEQISDPSELDIVADDQTSGLGDHDKDQPVLAVNQEVTEKTSELGEGNPRQFEQIFAQTSGLGSPTMPSYFCSEKPTGCLLAE